MTPDRDADPDGRKRRRGSTVRPHASAHRSQNGLAHPGASSACRAQSVAGSSSAATGLSRVRPPARSRPPVPSRALPGSSCVKRGCGAICPDGGCPAAAAARPPLHTLTRHRRLAHDRPGEPVRALAPRPRSLLNRASRFVLASTEELHLKINELSARVRSLEGTPTALSALPRR
jgi:hypothetical protein